jgi:hypothetical protein
MVFDPRVIIATTSATSALARNRDRKGAARVKRRFVDNTATGSRR